jgi:hypothetical protein
MLVRTTRIAIGQLSRLRAIVGRAIVLQFAVEVVVWQDVAAIRFGAVGWSRLDGI